MTPESVKIVPIGGLGEIGMNCMVIESNDSMIVIDVGVLFSDLDHLGIEFAIPDFTYLLERKDKLKGYILTHGHEDHIGALPFAIKSGLHAPIYCSSFTSLMVRERLKEYGYQDRVDLQIVRPHQKFSVGNFEIEAVSVNHSIVDALALVIDSPAGRIVHTGDFRIDPEPFFGSRMNLDFFKKIGDEGVDLLLSDSTNVERHEHNISEKDILIGFDRILKEAQGLSVVALFSSNIARMGQVFETARKYGKKVATLGRSVEQNVRLGQESGYLKQLSGILIPVDEIQKYPRDQVIVISSGCQGEYRAALSRIANGDDRDVKLTSGDTVLLSSRMIPGNELAISKMINQLYKQGADVLYETIHDIHTSGHATRPELAEMLQATRPRHFVPIHGEYRHLVLHERLAIENGVPEPKVIRAVNGDILSLSPHGLEKIGHFDEFRVLVEGREGNDVSKLMLKDRRKLAETGVVVSLILRNATSRRLLADPAVFSRGLAHEKIEGFLIDEARALVKKLGEEHEERISNGDYREDLQEKIRIELRRFFHNNIKKKPVVLSMVIDL